MGKVRGAEVASGHLQGWAPVGSIFGLLSKRPDFMSGALEPFILLVNNQNIDL